MADDRRRDDKRRIDRGRACGRNIGWIWREEFPAPAAAEPPEAPYRRAVLGQGQAALCLSGGGIRSAAFALGVLQALSAKHLLTHFHYLSTVSGGGYIGSWLQRWIHEEPGGAGRVMAKLGAVAEPAEVSALRENSELHHPAGGRSAPTTPGPRSRSRDATSR